MKSPLLTLLACSALIAPAHALIISEVMSNPTGDDSGREWIELYNDGTSDIDLSGMTVSIKGGSPISTTLVQGSTLLSKGAYGIIGSTVSGQTKFLQDYSSYADALFRGSVSLVNTGTTSIDIMLNGSSAASLSQYAPAKEGRTLSFVEGAYVNGTPTPGAQNVASDTDSSASASTTVTTPTQVTITQASPPQSDIVIYMPEEKVVVAGAESDFSVFSLTRGGRPISDLRYVWSFGDGGQATGSSTNYKYAYTGRYVAHVEALNATTFGSGRMIVRVVSPDIEISSVGSGKYGSYIDVLNPNAYPLDLSQWRFSIDGAFFPFPKNTLMLPHETVRFSGAAMGFASTTLSASTSVRILFPTLEEVARFVPKEISTPSAVTQLVSAPPSKLAVSKPVPKVQKKAKQASSPALVLGTSTSSVVVPASTSLIISTTSVSYAQQKDTRLISWWKSLFGK